MADISPEAPSGSAVGGLPMFPDSSGDVHPGEHETGEDFSGFPDSSGDVEPQGPQKALNGWAAP